MWIAVLAALVGEAFGCQPYSDPYGQDLLPRDGTTDFPTNGAVRVLGRGQGARQITAGLPGEYRLRGPDGELVPWTAQGIDMLQSLVPDAPLAPEAAYVIERKFAYQAGILLTDEMRWRHAFWDSILSPVTTLRWYPAARFATSKMPESRSDVPPLSVAASWTSNGGGCDAGEWVEATASAPDGSVTTDLFMLEVRDQGPVGFATLSARVHVGHDWMHPTGQHIRVEHDPEVRVSLLTAAGARLGTSEWVAARSESDADRRPHDPNGSGFSRSITEWVARFLDLPDDDSPRAPAQGPDGCPFGVVATDSKVEPMGLFPPPAELPSSASLKWVSGRLKVVNERPRFLEPATFWYRLGGGAVAATPRPRHTLDSAADALHLTPRERERIALAPSPRGSVVAWVNPDVGGKTADDNRPSVNVAWLDGDDGATPGPFVVPASGGDHPFEVSVVEHDGLAAVAWGSYVEREIAIVDRSGRASSSINIDHPSVLALGVAGSDFLMAYLGTLDREVHAARLDCRADAPFGPPEVLDAE